VAEDRSLRLTLFRLIPLLMLVSFVAWCSSSRSPQGGSSGPLATELLELMAQNGVIDGMTRGSELDGVAKRIGPAGMNRLLYACAADASLPALRWMVEHGADPRNIGAIENVPLIHKVAKRPQFERVEFFLKLGLDARQAASDGQTLMHVAAAGGLDERVLGLLLNRGLTLADATHDGKRPIHFASVKSIPVLAAAGADLGAVDRYGRTALHWAALEGRNDAATELLRMNASVFAVDRNGQTPLHLAAMNGSETLVNTLLAAGAPRTARDNDGHTPREIAESQQRSRYRSERDRMVEKL
jgi:ankyrin repeat protein